MKRKKTDYLGQIWAPAPPVYSKSIHTKIIWSCFGRSVSRKAPSYYFIIYCKLRLTIFSFVFLYIALIEAGLVFFVTKFYFSEAGVLHTVMTPNVVKSKAKGQHWH